MRVIRALFLSIFLAAACASLWGQTPGFFAYTFGHFGGWTFAVNPTTGALTLLREATIGGESATVHPSGRFLYGAVRWTGGAGPFGIDARTINPTTGALTEIPGSPFDGRSISQVAVDPTGQFLYATCLSTLGCGGPGRVLAFAIDADSGALTPIGSFSLGLVSWRGGLFAADNPQSVAVDPSGQFVYVANFNTIEGPCGCNPVCGDRDCPPRGSVSMYRIDALTGALTPLPGSALLLTPADPNGSTGPRALTVDPSGQFLYVGTLGGGPTAQGAVFAFRIDSMTGLLTPVPGSPVPSTLGPVAVDVDPSGQFLYVGNFRGVGGFSPSVSGFAIDAITGALTPVPGSPYPAVTVGPADAPNAVAVDPTGQFVYLTAGRCDVGGCNGGVTGFTIDPDTGALTLRARVAGGIPYGIVLVDLRPPPLPPLAFLQSQGK